ncbi:MAG: ATP-binding cassette domain-containing protein [Treponema sp.]|nr:ATP-binding cassette domain-containing protein [Treponema sp.]
MNILEITNVSKTYPGSKKKANNNISLNLKKGEILCIAGENGAGKTTLMKILCGYEKQDAGVVKKHGKIGMVFQHFMLFHDYTAAENIVMGKEPRKLAVFFDKKKANEIADKIISSNNFAIKCDKKVSQLSQGEMQQVEICRILYSNADIIILDEPTSILTENETQSLFNNLKTLAKKGKSIILITHKIHEIKQIGDRVIVLRRGEISGVCDVNEIDEKKIASLMTGEDIDLEYTRSCGNLKKDDPVIVFKNVTVCKSGQKRPLLEDVSFTVNRGEILGFTGVGGNGLGVIEAVLGGFLHPCSGNILHRGKDISGLNTRALRKQGLAYVPADRIRVGSALNASIEENLIIVKKYTENKKEKIRTDKEYCMDLVQSFNIEGADLKEKAYTLSGGNLQKLILAREINCFRDYIVFSEPTWGLDIVSSRFIMKEIDALRKKGAAVILISTNIDEITALCDRVIVMYNGRTAFEFVNDGDIGRKIRNAQLGMRNNE